MKKTYIRPALKVREVKTNQMLCGSPTVGFGSGTTDTMDANAHRGTWGNLWGSGTDSED